MLILSESILSLGLATLALGQQMLSVNLYLKFWIEFNSSCVCLGLESTLLVGLWSLTFLFLLLPFGDWGVWETCLVHSEHRSPISVFCFCSWLFDIVWKYHGKILKILKMGIENWKKNNTTEIWFLFNNLENIFPFWHSSSGDIKDFCDN